MLREIKRTTTLSVFFAAVLSLAASNLWALETDQYVAWGLPLTDSAQQINQYLERQVQTVLSDVNEGNWRRRSCRSIVEKIVKMENDSFAILDKVEQWAFANPSLDTFPSFIIKPDQVYLNTMYRYAGFTRFVPVAKTIEINGIRFGTDKLSHFISVGGEYLKRFQKNTDLQRVLDWGISTEEGIYGYTFSSIFSYADLEANFQGMNYLRTFCEGESPLLEQTQAGWKLAGNIDITPYVTPLWDESFNSNFSMPAMWKTIKPYLMAHCDERDSDWVKERFESYRQKLQPNASSEYLALKIRQRATPDPRPQSLDVICPSPKMSLSQGSQDFSPEIEE